MNIVRRKAIGRIGAIAASTAFFGKFKGITVADKASKNTILKVRLFTLSAVGHSTSSGMKIDVR